VEDAAEASTGATALAVVAPTKGADTVRKSPSPALKSNPLRFPDGPQLRGIPRVSRATPYASEAIAAADLLSGMLPGFGGATAEPFPFFAAFLSDASSAAALIAAAGPASSSRPFGH